MALVGNYNASTFIEGNPATYPPLPPGVMLYQPTMHWHVIGAGVVHGQAVAVGDLLYATGGHWYGDGLYGDLVYGATRGSWTAAQVRFSAWNPATPGPAPPYPNVGCPFTRDDLPGGDWAPGWSLVIEAFYNDLTGSRVYGSDTYGADVYGDVNNSGAPKWVDVTQPGYRVVCGDGTRDGAATVPVSEVVVELVDKAGQWYDFADPLYWYQPSPGTPIRVGMVDPAWVYRPLIVAEIERIEDVHDGDHPRAVSVRGFGQIMDLAVDVVGVQRPAELASTRFNALTAMAGWKWGNGDLVFPGDGPLLADKAARAIVVRTEIDRTVQSVGWTFDQDRYGGLRVRNWPLEPTGAPLHVVDCDEGDEAALVSPSIVFVNDQSQILNYVIATNDAVPNLTEVRAEDVPSIGRFDRRGRTLGFPKSGLAFADIGQATVWVTRVVNRYAAILRHTEDVVADTAVDHGWLAALAELDTGRALLVERHGVRSMTLAGVVVGFEHTINPGRWTSAIHTSTTTPSY